MKDLMGYQRLVTKWREQVKVLHRNADNSSYEYARAIFREQAQRIEKCADELAEVIARNVQPSPDDVGDGKSALFVVERLDTMEWVSAADSVDYSVFTSRAEAQDALDSESGSGEFANHFRIVRFCREARPVQQPATEPDEYFATGYTREDLSAMHPTIKLKPALRAEQFLASEENKTGMARTSKPDWTTTCEFAEAYTLALRNVPQGPNNQEEFEKYAKQHRLDIRPSEWQQSDWTYADADVESHWQCWLAARQVPVGPEGKK